MNKEEQHCYFWHATCMLMAILADLKISSFTDGQEFSLRRFTGSYFLGTPLCSCKLYEWIKDGINITLQLLLCALLNVFFDQLFSYKTQIIIIMYWGKITDPIYQLMVVSLHYIHDTQTYFSRVLTKCIRMIVIYILKFYNYS